MHMNKLILNKLSNIFHMQLIQTCQTKTGEYLVDIPQFSNPAFSANQG